jgi:hypothetical protein
MTSLVAGEEFASAAQNRMDWRIDLSRAGLLSCGSPQVGFSSGLYSPTRSSFLTALMFAFGSDGEFLPVL